MKPNHHPSRYIDPPQFPRPLRRGSGQPRRWPLILIFAAIAIALLAVIACLDA